MNEQVLGVSVCPQFYRIRPLAAAIVGYYDDLHCLVCFGLQCPNTFCRQRPGRHMHIVGQNRIYTPYMTVYLVISLPKMPYMHRIYMVLANPTHAPQATTQLGSDLLACLCLRHRLRDHFRHPWQNVLFLMSCLRHRLQDHFQHLWHLPFRHKCSRIF